MSYSNSLGGRLYRAAAVGAYVQSDPRVSGAGYTYDVAVNTTVTLTGFYIEKYGYRYAQITSTENLWIIINTGDWQLYSTAVNVNYREAQDIINKLIRNNQIIFENNLLLSRFASKLSSSERQQLYSLQKRLEERDEMLREADVFTEMGEAQILGYSVWVPYLQKFMSMPGIGVVISTTGAIIIAAVVAASLATAAYFAFQAAYAQSVQDVKLSNEMLRIFEKYNMTPEDVATIERETQGIVTKAVIMQKIKTTFGYWGKVLLFVGGGILAYKGLEYLKKKK